MSIGQTLLVFAGIPLSVILAVTGLAFAASARSAPRYRPGRPFAFTPVWYLAESTQDEPDRKALAAGRNDAGKSVSPLDCGGARGTW